MPTLEEVGLLLALGVQALKDLDVKPKVLVVVVDVCLLSLLLDVDELKLSIAATAATD